MPERVRRRGAGGACWKAASGLALAALLAPRVRATLVLPLANVRPENAKYYVFRDDVILFPISFSIPKERILSSLPQKTAFALNDSQRSFTWKNYQFGPLQEEEYHQNIQRHRFGDTRKKGGNDCLRHYELLANGCVPMVHNLEHFPPSIVTTLPRPLLWRARELFALPWDGTVEGPGECPAAGGVAEYEELAGKLLRYTAEHLSTESAARYVLDTMNIPEEGSKVLFLPCVPFDNFPSYLTASVFHGLVSILGDRVIDVPEYEFAYELADPSEAEFVKGNLWGQGYTLGFKLPRRPHLNRGNISQRIRAQEFSLIIFARMSPYEPCNFWYNFGAAANMAPQFFEDVFGRVPRERVALLYGDDSGLDDAVVRTHVSRMGALHRGVGYVFMRELLPFVGEGPPSEALRPVDDRLLQPGCFQAEWLSFFEQWHDGALRGCVARGDCDHPEVDDYLESWHCSVQMPPADPVSLQHFCRTGFALKAALLVQRLGPLQCPQDSACARSCSFCLGTYARGLMAHLPAELFFAEFGITAAQVVYVLSQGCRSATLALQPALAESRQSVIIVAEAAAHWQSAGPLAGERQLRYLICQGFFVLFVSSAASAEDLAMQATPGEPLDYLSAPRLQLAGSGSGGGDACGWYMLADGQPLHYVHIELPPRGEGNLGGLAARLRCLRRGQELPSFVSVQVPALREAQVASAAWGRAMGALEELGYRRFKVGSAPRLGGPVGELAADLARGPQWSSGDEVLGAALSLPVDGGQLHAAL